MSNKRNTTVGGILILIGLLAFAARYLFDIQILIFEPGDFWPIIVLGMGLMFEFLYFGTGKNPGFLVPGGILTVTGLLFFFEVATNWRFAEFTWPVYILAVAAGLFQLYLFTGKPRGLLIPVGILTSIAAIAIFCMLAEFVFKMVDIGFVVPVLLIIAGLYAIFRRKGQKNSW